MNNVYENGSRPKTAPCPTVCPVEIEVQSTNNVPTTHVQSPKQTTRKEQKKRSFWKSLFGEQKCPQCINNSCNCNLKSKPRKKVIKETSKNNNEQSKNKPFTSHIPNTQTNENCPTKCTLPINQRGVGCHLYFCIDSKPKKQTKSKKNQKNEHIKLQNNYCNFVNGKPQVTVICDNSRDSFDQSRVDQPVLSRESIKVKSNERFVKSCQSHRSCTSLSVASQNKFGENDTRKDMFKGNSQNYSMQIKENNVLQNTDSNLTVKAIFDEEISKPGESTQQRLSSLRKTENIKSESVDIREKDYSRASKIDNIMSEDKIHNHINVFQHTQDSVSYPAKSIISHDDDTKIKKYNITNKTLESIDTVSTDIQDNFSYLERQKKLGKKSIPFAKGSYVRNSLITLRREKRQSVLEGRISLILQKLTEIENKMEIMEKSKDLTEKNLKVGIACDSIKKAVSIRFDEKEGQKSKNQITSVTIKPSTQQLKANDKQATTELSDQALKDSVKIKSYNNKISIQTPGDVSVKKQTKKNPVEASKSKKVLYHNSYEMDVHVIGTNSNLTNQSFKCHNPKIVVSYPMKENQNPDSWRKISEELKISQGNVMSPKNCHCTKYFPS